MQMIEQNLQNFLMQRQQFQMQLIEVQSALEELKGKENAYHIVGNIMVSTRQADLVKELSEKKNMLELRISNLEKQESRLKEKSKSIRQEVLEGLQKKGEKK